ncbi:nickel/cobalt transporter [Allorhizobium undicola]|uniref:nickel/cobalt transporter n=1 Tax=Allorhizobium undicola TaxID=78527 RepID=UPI0004825825|nr:nickel/cobalt transporter [Allorhizobium undicola]
MQRIFRQLTVPALVLLLLAPLMAHAASPLGIGSSEPSFDMTGPFGGVMLWINTHQQAFYRSLTQSLIAMRDNWQALWTLVGLSFAYGVFHAAGPGHGKAVISSYMVANELELKRGIVIALVSSLLQGAVAIAVVGATYLMLRGTGITMTAATNALEIASFALVIAFGVWLLMRKLRDIFTDWRLRTHSRSEASGVTATLFGDPAPSLVPRPATGLSFRAEELDHDHRALRPGDICADCGRSHLPDPTLLKSETFSLREAWSAILAVGLRPCSGALLVMSFSLLNGLYLGGVLSVLAMALGTAITVSLLAMLAVGAKDLALRLSGPGSRLSRAIGSTIEIGGALFIILLGSLLLAASLQGGYTGA